MIWVNRSKEPLEAGQKKPTAEVKNLLEAAKLLGVLEAGRRAGRRRCTRTCSSPTSAGLADDVHDRPRRRRGASSSTRRCFPDELEALPARARAGRLRLQRAARHARRLGPPARAARLPRRGARLRRDDRGAADRASPATPPRELRAFDDEHYVERAAAAVARAGPGAAGARARSRSASDELELHPADGHTADGMAIWVAVGARARLRRLPLAGRDPDAVRGRLARRLPARRSSACAPLVEQADHVVPGHGETLDGARARGDPARGPRVPATELPDAELPLARRGAAQRAIHAENVERVGGS